MKKVKLDVIKPWMTQRITELLGVEDELVIDFAFGLLEEKVNDKLYMDVKYLMQKWIGSRSKADANQPDRFLGEKHSTIHSGVVETIAQCTRFCQWYP